MLPKKQWVKSFEEACERKGYDPVKMLSAFEFIPEHHRKAMVAIMKIIVIIEVLNNGWVPDWTNGQWDKWVIWCRMGSPSGAGFASFVCDDWHSASDVGSRLVLRSEELAEYVGTEFTDLFKDFMVLEGIEIVNAE